MERTSRWAKWRPRLGRRGPLTTREIATVAVLAAVGGVMSAYIGYLGVALNKLTGTPFGAGQFLAGLHVVWMVLAVLLTDRVGAGTATGVLKGTVELFAGSGKGVLVLLLTVSAGLVVDAVWALSPRRTQFTSLVAGGLGSSTNVVVFVIFTSTYDGLLWLFLLLLGVSLISGLVLAGALAENIARTLSQAGLLVKARLDAHWPRGDAAGHQGGPGPPPRVSLTRPSMAGWVITVAVLVTFFGGAAMYYASLGENMELLESGRVEVEGNVERPMSFTIEEFEDEFVTVEAELVGEFTHVGPRNYTGVPLRSVLLRAGVREGATTLNVVGADNYGIQLEFHLPSVMDEATANDYVLVREHGPLMGGGEGDYYRLVCRELDGGSWVRWVVRIAVF